MPVPSRGANTTVVVTGVNFGTGNGLTVTIGSRPCVIVSVTAHSSIMCATPLWYVEADVRVAPVGFFVLFLLRRVPYTLSRTLLLLISIVSVVGL